MFPTVPMWSLRLACCVRISLAWVVAFSGLPVVVAAPAFRVVHHFGDPDVTGVLPQSGLTEGVDGRLYGVCFRGGRFNGGVLYAVRKDGSGYGAVHHFGAAGQPAHPSGRLTAASDGRLYGTTFRNGDVDRGAVYSFDPATGKFQLVKALEGAPTLLGKTGVIEGRDGLLYGLADGDVATRSVVFRVAKDGSGYRILKTLAAGANGFLRHVGPLHEAGDGLLYGAFANGGAHDRGFLFRIGKDGSGYQVLRDFGPSFNEPFAPSGGVMQAGDGRLYGLLSSGSSPTDSGVEGGIYRVMPDGSGYEVIHYADYRTRRLRGELIEGPDGRLYGAGNQVSPEVPGLFALNKDGSGFGTVNTDRLPFPPAFTPLLAGDGLIYGIGASEGSEYGLVFSVPPAGGPGTHLRLISPTGGVPVGPRSLMDAGDRWLYGLTTAGNGSHEFFYKMRRDGTRFTVLRDFDPQAVQQAPPFEISMEDPEGGLLGPRSALGPRGGGVVVRLGPDGTYDDVIAFGTGFEGPVPSRPVGFTRLPDGTFIGMTAEGGTRGWGTVVRWTAGMTDPAVLHSFTGPPNDTEFPQHRPLLATDGRVYGQSGDGLFGLDPDGSNYRFRRLFGISGPRPSALSSLTGPLWEGADGALYGTAGSGGRNDQGGLFRVDKGSFEVTDIYPPATGDQMIRRPVGGVVQRRDGFLYGVTERGGNNNAGVFYRMRPDGTGVEIIHHFGEGPDNGLIPYYFVLGGDDVIYGSLRGGGACGNGALFRYGETPVLAVERGDGSPLANGTETIDFGRQEWGAPVATVVLTLRNQGELPLELSDFFIDGPAAADFAVSVPSPNPVPPGASAVLEVRFRAVGSGVRAAVLRWKSNDYDDGEFRVALSALVPSPEIMVFDGAGAGDPEVVDGQTAAVDFGVARRAAPLSRAIRIANTGGAPLVITRVAVPDGHRVTHDLPATVAIGEAVVVTLDRDTLRLGPLTGEVVIENNDPDEAAFRFLITSLVVDPEIVVSDLGAAGEPELVAGQADAVDIGRQVQGTPGSRRFRIANAGTAPLRLDSVSVPPGFELAGLPDPPALLEPGASLVWSVRLVTLEVGAHSGVVLIQSDDFDEAEFRFPVTGEVFIPDPVAGGASAETTLNRQTGFREQVVTVTNDTTATVPAFELRVRGLPDGVRLANATGRLDDGTFVMAVRRPLGPFSSVELTLEFASADRRPLDSPPLFSTAVVLVPPDDSAADHPETVAVDRIEHRPDGSLLIEFLSEPGRRYVVEYSGTGTAWKTSPVEATAAGTRTQWIDRGPPRTSSPPAATTSRFYRVRLLPE